ncbi:ComF family protein [Fusobacterium sp. IOR10]|uniref:ComF family protein n=1 Tax=Fusobacterium sp. IOR10 TaxID=2665157 RepID=UPI0013D10756|nr:phosphoribosyltransferase family protein [Fusobacterium sp. IOR10]
MWNPKKLETVKSFIFSNRCCICNELLDSDHSYVCENCKEKVIKKIHLRKFNKFYFVLDYDSDIKILIKNFKFYNKKYISHFLSELIKTSIYKVISENNIDLVIPVPISQEKKLERGFNQINVILELLNIPYRDIIRNKNTHPMSKFKNIYARHFNIKSSFDVPFNTSNKNILIVDDILTTGNTVKEIIKEIYKKGTPNSVFVFSISAANSFYKNIFSI